MFLIPFLACRPAPPDSEPLESPADSVADSPVDSTPPSFHGSVPEDPVSLPDFKALAQDGTPRGPDDLKGHPTVVWFYPLASSGG